MRIFGIAMLVAGAAALALPDAFADGFLGQRYFGIDGGWERMKNDDSDNGWRIGGELNVPGPMDDRMPFGMDLNIQADYRDVFDSDVYDVVGLVRAYTTPGDSALKPFLGVGFGWIDYDVTDTTIIPVEGGLEFEMADVGIMPFFRYSFALHSGVENFWTVGARGVYWVSEVWGVTVSGDYTDYDDLGGIEKGWTVRGGLTFVY